MYKCENIVLSYFSLLKSLKIPGASPQPKTAEWESSFPGTHTSAESQLSEVLRGFPHSIGNVSERAWLSAGVWLESRVEGSLTGRWPSEGAWVGRRSLPLGSGRTSHLEQVQGLLFQMKELVCLWFNYLFLQDLPSSIAACRLKEFN